MPDLRAPRHALDDGLAGVERGNCVRRFGRAGNLRQAVALGDVEHVVVPEQRPARDQGAFPLVALLLLHPLPEHQQVPLFAPPDAAAALLELVEGEEVVLGVPGGREEPGVDAGVVPPGDEVLRVARPGPGLLPRHGAAFQLLDDAVGDGLVDVEMLIFVHGVLF